MADFAFRAMVRFGRAKGVAALQQIAFGAITTTTEDDGRLLISTTINGETIQYSTMGSGMTVSDVMQLAERALEFIEGNCEADVDALLAGKIEGNVVITMPWIMI